MPNTNLVKIARKLRKQLTAEELKLWGLLRGRRFSKYKFRRQFPMDKYIVDFCCLRNRLIIELDGGQHSESKSDPLRDKYLHDQGFTVLRIWNNELNQNLEGVGEKILEYLKTDHPHLSASGGHLLPSREKKYPPPHGFTSASGPAKLKQN